MAWRGKKWIPLQQEIAERKLSLGTYQESEGKAIHLYVDSEYFSWYLLCGLYGLGMHKKYAPSSQGLDSYPVEEATCGNCLRLRAKAEGVVPDERKER